MPPPRSKTTCYQCRARKVRCAGGPGTCKACERLGFNCSFQVTSLVAEQPQLERKRGPQACVECRSQKSKCSGEQPRCAGCRRRGRECVYPDSRRRPSRTGRPKGSIEASPSSPRQSLPSVDSPSPGSDTEIPAHQLPSVHDQTQLIAGFFRHVYPIPLYSFLHEESVMQRCLEGNLPEALNLAICAISALHLQDHRYHPVATLGWIRRAEGILWSRIEHPTIFRTQALLLIIQYRIETGEFQKAFMLSSIASRAASALRLHYERTDIHPLAQEVRRRLMWCLILMDTRFSSGLPECELCPFENVYLNRPLSEEEFSVLHETGRDHSEVVSRGIAENGLLSLLIRQVSLRRDISRLKRQVSLAGNPVPQLEDLVNAFKRNLEQVPISPYRLEDLREHSQSRWLLRYALAHLSWHQCHCDLYRLFLSGYKEAAPDVVTGSVSPRFTENAVRVCLHHAQCIIAILHDLADLDADFKVVDSDIAICSYHASRIIIFISRSSLKPPDSEDLTTESAVTKARSTLAILRRLYRRSTLAKYILSDLEAVIQDPTTTAVATTDEEAPEDDQPPDPKRPRFARKAQKHQNLAVHSVLRHALFVDDSHRAAGHSKKQSKKPNNSPGPNAASTDVPQEKDSPHAATNMIHNRYDAFGGLAIETDVLPDAAVGDFLGLSSQGFNDPFGSTFWGNWDETWGSNEWPMGSDENYF